MTLLCLDPRIGGKPRYFLGERDDMPLVPEAILKCVAFVGYRTSADVVIPAGTAFFLERPLRGVPDRSFRYAVTAQHVLNKVRSKGDRGCLRVNTTAGTAEWINFDVKDWISHPDSSVDAAIMPWPFNEQLDEMFYPSESYVSAEVIAKEHIGVGEEVFMTGLFVNHYGQERNIPIVRVGNIAAMPDERVSVKDWGDVDAYLIEARSIGGLSGSPVFAHLGIVRMRDDGDGKGSLVWAGNLHGKFYWMGLVQAHYDGSLTDADAAREDAIGTQERVNMGIAIVVPASRIVELFEEPMIRKHEEEQTRIVKEQTAATLDAADIKDGPVQRPAAFR